MTLRFATFELFSGNRIVEPVGSDRELEGMKSRYAKRDAVFISIRTETPEEEAARIVRNNKNNAQFDRLLRSLISKMGA